MKCESREIQKEFLLHGGISGCHIRRDASQENLLRVYSLFCWRWLYTLLTVKLNRQHAANLLGSLQQEQFFWQQISGVLPAELRNDVQEKVEAEEFKAYNLLRYNLTPAALRGRRDGISTEIPNTVQERIDHWRKTYQDLNSIFQWK